MNTQDLSQFGYREIDILADLLKAYANNPPEFFSDNVTFEFNPNSGVVFLLDEDLNVGVLEDDKIVQFFSCPECGEEGTATEFNNGDISDHKVTDGQVEHLESDEA